MSMLGLLFALISITLAQLNPTPNYRQASNVVVITIDGAVDSLTAQSVERRLNEAKDADAIVFELNTPGGDLMSTLQICYQIKNNSTANTVAWIRPHAFSAGTIIALACREIVIAPNGMFGDAAPVNITGTPIPTAERAKIESPVLAEVIDSARRNHYDERLVEGFVSVGIELWLLQNVETDEIICVNSNEYQSIFNEVPPNEFTPIATGNEDDQNNFTPLFGKLAPSSKPENTPDEQFVQQLPSSRKQIANENVNSWKLIKQIVPKDRLLTLKPGEGKQYGLIKTTIKNDTELKGWFGATEITRLHTNWSERFVSLLISWPVRLALIALFVICIVTEFMTGSSGTFGIAGSICMALLMGAPWIAGLAQWWDVLLVFIGLLFIVCEIMVIPGTGFTGLIGVTFLFVGMVGSFISGDLNSAEGQSQLITGISTVGGGVCIAGVAIWFFINKFGNSPTLNKLVLEDELHSKTTTQLKLTVGMHAVAATDLRPSGKIMIDEQIFDATTTGSWISEGAAVCIIETGLTIEVEEIEK